jgi:uncharacterized protein (DUF1697 family)
MTGAQYRYIALLRAINVGGHSSVRMAALRKVFELLGLKDVTTYIQSGNVIFSTNVGDREELTRQLEVELMSSLGYEVKVFVLSQTDLKEAAAHNPFGSRCRNEELRCQLMFLSAAPSGKNRKALMAMQGDEYGFHIHGKVLYYSYSKEVVGRRRNIDFEKVLGVSGTSRSWKVIDKLIELSAPHPM